MGRISDGCGIVGESGLFGELPVSRERKNAFFLETSGRGLSTAPKPPDQTNSKAKLIAEYITNYQRVTKGGVVIDGFAAPQSRDHEDAWSAARVLAIKPEWIRRFWLCDIEPGGIAQLMKLKERHDRKPRSRRVSVMQGDFNETVDTILMSGRIKPKTPTFAFLDQRNMECQWATVQKLARFRTKRKIELMYFLGTGWLMRSIKSSTKDAKFDEINRWWGGDGWQELDGMRQTDIAQKVARRFEDELGYQHVKSYPILLVEGRRRVAFHLIHASDHELAPVLMARAYLKICGDIPNSPVDSQGDLFGWNDVPPRPQRQSPPDSRPNAATDRV